MNQEERVEQLQGQLKVAQETIMEQNELLERLCAAPNGFATILETSVVGDPQKLLMTKGTEVVVSRESEHYGQKEGVGRITHVNKAKKNGYVTVKWPDEYENTYGIGNIDGIPRELDLANHGQAGYVIIASPATGMMEVALPIGMELVPGDLARLSKETGQILDVRKPSTFGSIAYVTKIIDDDLCEVTLNQNEIVVFTGEFKNKLEEGDKVILDYSDLLVIENLGQDAKVFAFDDVEEITWDDIGGLVEAKAGMIEAIENPVKLKDLYEAYGKKSIKGVLLYGPPGCGKTLLGKAAATSVRQVHGAEQVATGFIYVKGPEILDRYVGMAEAAVRSLFLRAHKHFKKEGYPAVIFIDEADAILGKRGSGISSDVNMTIVPSFLTEMDGMEDSGALVILATNRADIIDPAIVRDGRIDRRVMVGRPSREAAAHIFTIHLQGVPLKGKLTIEEAVRIGVEQLFSDRHTIYNVQKKSGEVLPFGLHHVSSGSMIANVVDQATSRAIARDEKENKAQGVTLEDIETAVRQSYLQNLDFKHSDALQDFTTAFRGDVKQIHKITQVPTA